jgi:hypothetical protein
MAPPVDAWLLVNPALCDASLENRLKPRLAEAQEACIPVNMAELIPGWLNTY